MHRRDGGAFVPRALSAIVGLVALVVAGLGAVDVADEQQAVSVAAPAQAPVTTERESRIVQVQRAVAARRAQVQKASRDYTREPLEGSGRVDQTAARAAQARRDSLSKLDGAAKQRSAQIRQEIRERRLERRRERRERRRELARQRRIERRNQWVVPVSGYEITATFGAGGSLWSSDHTGLDLAAGEGSPVGSTAGGEVTYTGYDGAYGNKVVVTHEDGTETWYCHLASITVSSGESVEPGSTIGTVGMTGNTTGPHLHLEVHPGGGGPVDPYSYLQEQGAF